ncbi:hypothetical protein BDFB_008928 [Asbolus verrucosus]|uniref:Uncharacterized protein n=1 Tax=Asbolus verrucosus TaxID=1661398 RepID=A0A482VR16_ASBVE|nr:hypothetical protein BDFB_008928 [Asbolus verrucosus]
MVHKIGAAGNKEPLSRHIPTTLVDVITIELPTAGILSVIPCEKRDHCERLTANLCKADYNHKFSDLILTHIPLKTTADHGAVVVALCDGKHGLVRNVA